MSSDDAPSGQPGLFNTFSGHEVPVEAYNLLSQDEADKHLTDRDRELYKDPEFALVVRSRIWEDLKNSVSQRREAYLERHRQKTPNHSLDYKSDDEDDSDHKQDIEDHNHDDNNDKQENESQNITTPTENTSNTDINDHTIYTNDNDDNDQHNNGSIYAEDSNDHHDTESDKEPLNTFESTSFANPFTPFQTAMDIDHNNTEKYAIPFDVFNLNGTIDNTNWTSPFHDQEHQEETDNINNDSNDSETSKNGVRKSEIFADPFHWDTDDENNHNALDDTDEEDDDMKMNMSLKIDINTPFKDPFHSSPQKKDSTPSIHNDIVTNNDQDTNQHNELFANPFPIGTDGNIQNKDEHKNESVFGLLFDETEQHNDNMEQFANPFQQNSNPLSPLLPFNTLQHNKEDTTKDNISNPFSNQHNGGPFSPSLISVTASPFRIDVHPPADTPSSVTLTPVPSIPEKRGSAVMQLPLLTNTLNESEEQEYSQEPQKHIKTVSNLSIQHALNIKDEFDFNKDEVNEVNQPFSLINDDNKEAPIHITSTPIAPKKHSLSFSWSDHSKDSMNIIHQPTPPPIKSLTDELYELLATLLAKFIQNPKAYYMVNGVPWEKWGCLDWPNHFKLPSTLTQVRDALDNNEYDTPGQFAESVRNVFRNYTTYHWKGVGQYRVNTRAGLLWEDFNKEYFQVLTDESEERKRDESRKRAIDEARDRNDSREREYTNTHTVSTDLEEDQEEEEEEEEEPPPICKKVSWKEDIVDETEEEFAAMAQEMSQLHYEMSQHLSTRPTTPQPPYLTIDFQPAEPELPGYTGLPLGTLFSQEVMNVKRPVSGRTSPLPDPIYQTVSAPPPNASRRVSMESLGAVSVNSRNVRFQSPEQAQRALRISNTLQSLHREESFSRTGSVSSITSIFRRKKAKHRLDLARAALLAKISKSRPAGFNPNQRRGSITNVTRTSPALPSIAINGTKIAGEHGFTVKSEDALPVVLGDRHRASKELIQDCSPPFKANLPQTEEMSKLDLELQKNLDEGVVPGPYAHLKFEFFIMIYCSVLLILYMINYRLLSNQNYPLLYPMTNIGARIISVFTEPLFIVSMLGSIIVVHVQYRPNIVFVHKNLFIAVFVIANILNILRVSMSHCTMDFLYDIYIYFITISTMVLPFFSFGDKWKESETVFILFVFWIGVILIGFVFVILHAYVTGFIMITCYIMLIAWIIRFLYSKSLGVFDDIGNLSSKYDIGYCCLLIPALLLFPQLGAAIVISLNNLNLSYSSILSSVYGYYILLKITFCIGRSLWETTALKGTDHCRYIHLMFPIFFLEELLDSFLLMKLQFSWEMIGLLILMAITHLIRDSDIGYRFIYKLWIIPLITTMYYGYYNANDSRRNLFLVRNRSSPLGEENDCDHAYEMNIGIDIDHQEDKTKELNLAQERDDIHVARIIIHFQMIQFAQFASRIAVVLLILMDIICDAMHIGKRLLLIDNGSINETKRGFLILLCFISLITIFITNIISQRLLSEQALTSIQFLEKLECINDFSYKERLYIHEWVIFGDDCEIFKRFWIFFAFIVGYQFIIISQAFFTNNGLISICNVFF